MGLRANPSAISGDPQRDYEILAEAPAEVLIESLIEYGFVPEFAGRFPIIVPLAPLTKDQMRLALTEPKNSVIKQQVELFRRDGMELIITDEALDAIVEQSRQHENRRPRPAFPGQKHDSQARYDLAGDPDISQCRSRPGDAGRPDEVQSDPCYLGVRDRRCQRPCGSLAEAV